MKALHPGRWLCHAIQASCILLFCTLLSFTSQAGTVTVRTNFVATTVGLGGFLTADARVGNVVYVTGYFFDSEGLAHDGLVIRYDNRGNELWTNRLDDFAALGAQNITRSGRNLLVVDSTWGQPPESSHLTLRKITTKGRLLWRKDFDSGNAYHIHEAKDGSIFLPSSKGLVKLDKNGEGVWTNSFGLPSGLHTDSFGNVYVGGAVGGSQTNIGGTNYVLSPPMFVITKFDSHGSLVWSNQIPQPFFYGSMCVNPRGRVYLAVDGAMIKFGPTGVPVWTNTLDSSGVRLSRATHVALDSNGDVHLTGWDLGGELFNIVSAKVTAKGGLVWLQAVPQLAGYFEAAPARFTRVAPSGVAVEQHNMLYDVSSGAYTFVTHTAKFRAP